MHTLDIYSAATGEAEAGHQSGPVQITRLSVRKCVSSHRIRATVSEDQRKVVRLQRK